MQGRGVPEMWLSNHRWVELTAELYDAGCAMSGLIADSRTLIDRARVEAQNHWFTYNENMSVESVTQAVSNLALAFGDDDPDPGAMVCLCLVLCTKFVCQCL